jgi:Sulfotransferase family
LEKIDNKKSDVIKMFWLLVLIVLIIIVVLLFILFDSNDGLSSNTKLIFIHIPKNAGTTITQLARDNGIEWTYQAKRRYLCSKYHIPPLENIKSYKLPIFCIVRNPYTKVLSEYNYKNSSQDLNEYIDQKLDQVSQQPCLDDCHWIPQYHYTLYCDHILHFENLSQEFNNLMIKYNLNMRLNKHENKGTKTLSITDLSPSNIQKINNYYHKDFETFGYKKI